MKHDTLTAAATVMDPRLAADTGELAVGCADVGGRIEEVAGELADQVEALAKLERVTADLEADQAQVARATEEAKVLSAKAAENIQNSAQQISSTVAEFGQLTDLIERLGTHVTNFAAAMEQGPPPKVPLTPAKPIGRRSGPFQSRWLPLSMASLWGAGSNWR